MYPLVTLAARVSICTLGDRMNIVRSFALIAVASIAAACSSTPSKPAAPPAPPPAPAINVAGNWVITVDSQFGSQDAKMSVKQEGTNLSGTMESPQGSMGYTGTLVGNNIKFGFSFNAQGTDLKIDYAGTTDGTTMNGKVIIGTFGEGTFKGKRQ